MDKTYLPDMTYKEAEMAFEKTDTALFPLGSVEVHGPHGLLGTDFFAADEVAQRTGRKCGNAIVLPALPFGYTQSTMDFPGTITVDPSPYRLFLEGVCRSMHKWGIRRVVWISGHGPNVPIAKQVAVKLRDELGMLFASPLWYRLAIQLLPEWQLGPDHGGFTETSVAMAIRPGNVDLSEAKGGCVINDFGHGFDSSDKYEIGFEEGSSAFHLLMKDLGQEQASNRRL
jgi:creatinine amidohydrolase